MQMVKVLLFSMLISISAFGQVEMLLNTKKDQDKKAAITNSVEKSEEILDELRTPQETMRTFIRAMDHYKTGDYKAINEAVATIDLDNIDTGSRLAIGKLTAERIVNTIDRIAKVNYSHIPTYENGENWFFRKQTVTINGQVIDVEISLHKTATGWKFTPETVKTIEDFYHSVEKNKVVEGVIALSTWKTKVKDFFPDWTGEHFLGLKNGQWLGLILIGFISIFVFFASRLILNWYITNKTKSEGRYQSTLPIGLLSSAIVFRILILFLELDIEFLEIILRIDYILIAVCLVWSALKIVDYISYHFEKRALLTSNKFDDVLVPMIKTTAKVLVVAFGGLLIAHSLTFDVASILAGLGIGGVAIAFAAKDTIANLFGSVTVLLDRPFNIGDYIVLDKIEGTVEQVGFRSTRIRTPINSLVTMPNSVLANLAIDNYGMRSYRRYRTMVGLEYNCTEDAIQNFIDKVRYSIQLNPAIEKTDVQAQVYLYDLAESSINILLSVHFKAPNIQTELEERQKLIVEIIRIAGETGVSFAYPTRTLFLKKEL